MIHTASLLRHQKPRKACFVFTRKRTMKKLYFGNLILLVLLVAICARAEKFSNVKSDITVAIDGSGDVKTVNEAIAKVPENNKKRFVVFIKPGVYKEQIRVPATKP